MKQKHITGIGQVIFVKRKRGKYVNISVKPSAPVQVSLPYYVSYKYAEDVLHEKLNWVHSKIEKIKETEKKLTTYLFDTDFKTKRHKLVLRSWSENSIRGTISNGTIEVLVPNKKHISDEVVQKAIRKIIEEAYRIEAKMFLPLRVKELADEHKIIFNNVYIKKMKTQWGSCSRKKNINLNLHLMRLPNDLIDYIILHELTHIDEMNHSKRFWSLLDKRLPNSKQLDKEVRSFSLSHW